MQLQLAEVPSKIMELGVALGVENINRLPGAWIHQVDNRWCVAANGHDHDVEISGNGEFMGATIPPYHFAIWRNGWLAGLMDAFDGFLFVMCEDELIAALDGAIADAS